MLKAISKLLGKDTIARGAMIVMFSSVLTGVVTFALMPLWTYFLSPEEFGLFGLVQASAGLVQGIVGLGIYAAMGRFVHDDLHNEHHVGSIVSNSIKCTWVASALLCCAAAFIVTAYLGGSTDDGQVWLYVLISMVWVWFNVSNSQASALFVAFEKHHINAIVNITSLLVGSGIAVALVVWADYGILGRFLGNLAGAGLVGVVLIYWLIKRYWKYKLEWKTSKAMLVYGAPLIVHTLASILLAIGDRFVIERMIGLQAAGLYTVAYLFGKPLEFLIGAISQAWSPRYFRQMQNGEEGDKAIRKFNKYWTLIMVSFVCVATIIAPIIFTWLVEERYQPASPVIAPVIGGLFLMGVYHLSVGPIYVAKKTHLVATTTLVSALVNIGANIILVPMYGIVGAAYGTLISYAMMAVTVTYISKPFHPQFDQVMKLWKWFILVVIFSVIPWAQINITWAILTAAALIMVMFMSFKLSEQRN